MKREDERAVLALNNTHAVETSELTPERLSELLDRAFFASRVNGLEGLDGFVVAFDRHAAYDSPNFLWFRENRAEFVYVDRVVVAAHARGRGVARLLYEALFEAARAAGHSRIVCEINSLPPNPGSDAFHAALGFAEVGRATLKDGAKSVRYMEKRL